VVKTVLTATAGPPENESMRGLRYWWRVTGRRSGRQVLLLALLGGLLGGVALGAAAGARRTATAYGRYLDSIQASDAFVNVPGKLPAEPVLRPIRLISGLPGIASHGTYLGLFDRPIVHGRLDPAQTAPRLLGSLDGEYFRQDKMTVLAGRLPPVSARGQIVLTPGVARAFGVRVGGRVSYAFQRFANRRGPVGPVARKSYRVAAIVQVPPVLVDSTDLTEVAVLPPGATRPLLPYYGYAWVGVRLADGPAGLPRLQHELAGLGDQMAARERRLTGNKHAILSFFIQRYDTVRGQVRQAIRPQVIALSVISGIAALALLVLAGQGLTQLVSRSADAVAVLRMLGASRAQAAAAAALPGLAALAGGAVLAVAGAIALSPLAPVGPVRRYDPARGVQADGLVLGVGLAVAAVILLTVLAVLTWRAARPRPASGVLRGSAIAAAAGPAGLPPAVVIGSRNALEAGTGPQAAPVRVVLLGAATAVTAVVTAVVFGTSLGGLVSHPARYGWNWDLAVQTQAGFGNFVPGRMARLLAGQPAVAGWSELSFDQLPIDGQVLPVMGITRHLRPVQPPTVTGHPLDGDGQIELGQTTLRQLGKQVGDTVRLGSGPHAQQLVITGTVVLPSFGIATSDHVSLGRGALIPERGILAAEGYTGGPVTPKEAESLTLASSAVIDLAPGTTAAQRSALVHRIVASRPDASLPGSTYEVPTAVAASISNARQMGDQPLALAAGLAVAALLSLGLTVLGSVRRRRQELALLKALGMTRGALRAVVAWQTTLTLVIAMAVGIPLGIAAGRWAWHSFAGELGVVPVTEIPLLVLAAGVILVAAAGNLLAAVPAAIAARTRSAQLLRAG
jgi:hypothetical protein